MNIALITGATSGIGYELAKCHANEGKDLVIVSRNIDNLNKVAKELMETYNIKVICIQKDLSKPNSAEELYNEVKNSNIEIDYLINNAGIGLQGYFHEKDSKEYTNLIQLNITSLTTLTNLFIKDFVNKNQGKILNVSSIASLQPGPMLGVYAASKSYVQSFSNSIATEVKQYNVTVTSLLPGITETKFGDVSDMNKTIMFKNPKHPKIVASKGYKAMIKGKLNIKAGVSLPIKILLLLGNVTPRRLALKITMYLQK